MDREVDEVILHTLTIQNNVEAEVAEGGVLDSHLLCKHST